jgi:hypothetical protein
MTMTDKKDKRFSTSLRGALQQTWDLHIRAIPMALLWAVSLLFIFQAPNLFTRLACSVLCSVVSLLNTSILKFSYIRVKPSQLIKNSEFMAMLTLNVFMGSMFVIALNNAVNLEIDSRWFSLAIVSTVPTFFILWLAVMLIANPIYIMLVATKSKTPITQSLLLYLQKRKKEAIITGLIFAVFAPIIFVFIAITLTVTQSLTIKTWEELNSEDKSQDEV